MEKIECQLEEWPTNECCCNCANRARIKDGEGYICLFPGFYEDDYEKVVRTCEEHGVCELHFLRGKKSLGGLMADVFSYADWVASIHDGNPELVETARKKLQKAISELREEQSE